MMDTQTDACSHKNVYVCAITCHVLLHVSMQNHVGFLYCLTICSPDQFRFCSTSRYCSQVFDLMLFEGSFMHCEKNLKRNKTENNL